MAIKGNVREPSTGNYAKQVGIFEAKVIGFNPDKEELENILETEIQKDPEYLGEDQEGNAKTTISVWLEDVISGNKFNARFTIVDKERTNKAGDKFQFINSVGLTTWADEKSNTGDWFTKFLDKDKKSKGDKQVRKALNGEEQLYSFLRAWLKLDYFDPSCELILDNKKLFRGNMKELNDMVKSDFAGTVVCLAIVRTVKNDKGETNDYQGIYNKAFLPGSFMKEIRLGAKKKSKSLKYFIENIEDREYGCSDHYSLETLHEYDPSQNLVATDKVIEEDDASY